MSSRCFVKQIETVPTVLDFQKLNKRAIVLPFLEEKNQVYTVIQEPKKSIQKQRNWHRKKKYGGEPWTL